MTPRRKRPVVVVVVGDPLRASGPNLVAVL